MIRKCLVAAIIISALQLGCATEIGGESPPMGKFHYPIGVTLGPEAKIAYVVNSNFNAEYKKGSIASVLLDTNDPAGSRILGSKQGDPLDSRLLIDSFAGNIAIEKHMRKDDKGEFYRAYVPIRENNAVEVVRIGRTEVKDSSGDSQQVWASLSSSGRVMTRRGDPFRVMADIEVECPGGQGRGLQIVPMLAVLHLARGEMVFLDLDALDTSLSGGELEQGREVLAGQIDLPGGTNDVAMHPATRELYVTSRFTSSIEVLTPDPGTLCYHCKFCEQGNTKDGSCVLPDECQGGWNHRRITVSNYGAGGTDMRGLAFSTDGSKLYVADRGPNSLLVFDTSIGENGEPNDKLVDVAALPASPAMVKYLDRPNPLDDLVLVTCFEDGRLWILDAETLSVIMASFAGDGPYEIQAGHLTGLGDVAFVPDFDGASLAMINLNEGPAFGSVLTFIH
ncbi:MAG: hypothetical protein GXP49_05455 [Deltaproteobacteria bacterium]|nr:hypothetical protein [Deltaproteobacteria bacterium]